jgi:hypothetical protein
MNEDPNLATSLLDNSTAEEQHNPATTSVPVSDPQKKNPNPPSSKINFLSSYIKDGQILDPLKPAVPKVSKPCSENCKEFQSSISPYYCLICQNDYCTSCGSKHRHRVITQDLLKALLDSLFLPDILKSDGIKDYTDKRASLLKRVLSIQLKKRILPQQKLQT